MRLPARIGDYTDFYASVHHATNVGQMFRPDSPLTPNYKHLPIGYHGRASSVVASGTEVRRPWGQGVPTPGDPPVFGPSRYLDYELEMGCFVGGRENALGTPIPIAAAEDRTFGLCLLNDWSARDLQVWESQPLGPFVSKSFATSISPWVLTLEALAPFRCAALARSETDPTPLPYLTDARPSPAIDVTVEAYLSTVRMRAEGRSPFRVTRGSLSSLYWTFAQLIAHHASGGCNLRAGDLLGSGTISGAGAESLGCLLERTRRGADPLRLPGGEQRTMLEDGDEILLEAYCERPGFVRIGFGGCRGRILPAQAATRY
jgi:fumarylacetoacetase